MRFFNAKRSKVELERDLRSQRLSDWWRDLRNDIPFFGIFSSYQTQILDKSIMSRLQKIEQNQDENRRNMLSQLYAQVLNWQHIHTIKKQHSFREEPVSVLRSWLEEQLSAIYLGAGHKDWKKEHYSQRANDILTTMTVESSKGNMQGESTRYTSFPLNNEKLYAWWKKNSSIGWFKMRSQATKELDKVIYWFSENIILDRAVGLQEILDAIEVWLIDREMTSERVPAVKQLQKIIADELLWLSNHSCIDFDGVNFDYDDSDLIYYQPGCVCG